MRARNTLVRRLRLDGETNETGFGIIEIVVAMFLLALVALFFLPVLNQGMKVSASNSAMAAATQLVGDNIEQAHTQGSVCADIQRFAGATVDPSVGARGVSLQVHRSPVICPTSASAYPTTVTVFVSATQTGSPDVLASATTQVLVTAAS